MIGSTRQVAVHAFAQPADTRKTFDALSALVLQGLKRDPLCGDLFLFVSRDRKRAKVLYRDGTGLCVFAKRLERGRFTAHPPVPAGGAVARLDAQLAAARKNSKRRRAQRHLPDDLAALQERGGVPVGRRRDSR